jgi:hypothetical protein
MRIIIKFVTGTAAAMSLATIVVWACGPHFSALQTVAAVRPAHEPEFVGGELGVVRPQLRRANLVMAYRVLSGAGPTRLAPRRPMVDAESDWIERRDSALGGATRFIRRTRSLPDYAWFDNCLEDAFRAAVATFDDRAARFGRSSGIFRDWVRAQDTVFSNCGDDTPLALPPPAAADAPLIARADRDYQIAAAYFYGMQYGEAARRFRAIAADAASPWRPYGRYLAARAATRAASVADGDFADAEQQLLAVVADPIAAPVHESARGLLARVRLRLRPGDELRRLARRLTTTTDAVDSDLDDFRYLMDHIVGDRVRYPFTEIDPEAAGVEGNDLVEWIIAFQGTGDEARERAVSRWRSTPTEPWLIAALWHVTGPHPAAGALLDGAAAVPATSTAYATVSFYRIRLLIALGRRDEARRLLAALPENPAPGFPIETINLFRAERLLLARDLDEFLRHAPRIGNAAYQPAYVPDARAVLSFDADAAVVLDRQLPLERLIEAALSSMLPQRLQTRVTIAAFTRAVVLDRQDEARRLAPTLRGLAPELGADLDNYLAQTAPSATRHAAALLLVRTPGMTTHISGLDSNYSVDYTEPSRRHRDFFSSWWCPGYEEESALVAMLYPASGEIPTPAWVTPADHQAAATEHAQLLKAGSPARFLATAVLDFVREQPNSPAAPEALARVVNGWRRTCRDAADAPLARRAFQQLHRRYPQSSWAKQTRYWHR